MRRLVLLVLASLLVPLVVAQPRLSIIDFSISPLEIGVGDRSTVSFVVENSGTTTLTGVEARLILPPGLKLESGQLPTVYLGTIPPHESRDVSWIVVSEREGEYRVRVRVTSTQGVETSAEGTLKVAGAPPPKPVPGVKLLVWASVTPMVPQLGTRFVLSVRVSNVGEQVAAGVSLSLDMSMAQGLMLAPGESLVKMVGNVPPGGSRDVSWSLIALNPGDWLVRVVVNALNAPSQAVDVVVTVPQPVPQPALPARIDLVRIDLPQRPRPGARFLVGAVILNAGTGMAQSVTATISTTLSLAPGETRTKQLGTIGPGEYEYVYWVVTGVVGTHTVSISVNSLNAGADSSYAVLSIKS